MVDAILAHASATGAWEDRLVGFRRTLTQPCFQNLPDLGTQWGGADLSPLAETADVGAGAKRHVLAAKRGQLGDAQTSLEGDEEERPVTPSDPCGFVWSIEERIDSILSEEFLPLLGLSLAPLLLGVGLFSERERYLIFALPAVLLLTTRLMALVQPDTWRRWIPLAVLLTISFNTGYPVRPCSRARTFAFHIDRGWTRAVRALEQDAAHADVVVYGTGSVEVDQLARPDPDRWSSRSSSPPSRRTSRPAGS